MPTARDSMGEMHLPEGALWGASTQRAVDNFDISGVRMDPVIVEALATLKAAAAQANAQLGVISRDQSEAICSAALSIAEGEHSDAFPVDVFQTGSGTSTNMNLNEVIASLATRQGVELHPNDHVNASQSSNDIFPSALAVAAVLRSTNHTLPALAHLGEALSTKATEFADVVKPGRTHLMDATPVTLGQEFGGYAQILSYACERIEAALPRVRQLPLGGTAVGTGINTPDGFAQAAIAALNTLTGETFTEAANHFEAQGGRDALVELSGQLRTVAVGLTKICNDLRWMGSGPRTGLGEIRLPALQPGSSIMPGKVNPVLPEATLMVCAQVVGNDATIAWAGASGSLELNVMMPVIGQRLLDSLHLLGTSARALADRCVLGLQANVEHNRLQAASSTSVVTPLNSYVGYERAARIAKRALSEQITVREAALAEGVVDDGSLSLEELNAALDVARMT